MPDWDLRLIEQAFADAAVDPSCWNKAMEVVSDATGSSSAALLPINGSLLLPHDQKIVRSLQSYVADGRTNREALNNGVADLDATTPHGFLAPPGHQWSAGVLVAAGSDQWVLSIQRSVIQGPFSSSEQRDLAKLSPSLSSAAALARALGFSAAKIALEAFELSGMAIVLLNRAGEPIQLNRQAERLLGAGIRIKKKRLIAETPEATKALDRVLYALIWTNGAAPIQPVRISRANRRPLLAYPLKLSSIPENVFSECRAILALVDLEKRDRPSETILQMVFGLTTAEARLACRLATGEAVEIASEDLHIAKETARNHLKNIFAKTGVHRQAELVALFASLIR